MPVERPSWPLELSQSHKSYFQFLSLRFDYIQENYLDHDLLCFAINIICMFLLWFQKFDVHGYKQKDHGFLPSGGTFTPISPSRLEAGPGRPC